MKQPELGKIILDLRTQKGLTQEELVEKCNISVRTIQRIEAGEVTPRLYTIKTILEVLGYDLEKINEKASSHFKKQLNLKTQSGISKSLKTLRLAIVFGMLYFLLGFLEIPADWSRWFEQTLIFSNPVYIAIKVAACATFIVFTFGFLTLGNLFNNALVKFASFAFIVLSVILYSLDILSLYADWTNNYYIMIFSVLFGAVGIALGIGIIQLNKSLGDFATVTGVLEILMSIMFLTVVLAWLGYLFLALIIILELILLFKVVEKIKNNQ